MKFWKKIFSYSVLLFVILLNLAGTIIVEKTFKENLQESIVNAIGKYNDVENTLYLNADYLLDVDVSDPDGIRNWVDIIIKGYVLNTSKEKFNMELYAADNTLILSDWEGQIEGRRPELERAEISNRKFLIRKVDGKQFVFISSIITIKNTELKLILSSDIGSVYEGRRMDYEFFLWLSLGISLLLAVLMYVISIRLTRPIQNLSETAMEIAKGKYGSRVCEYGGKDEIEALKHNFNRMADVIEENIEELKHHNEAKQRFIDSLNHEIKTPITSIIGYSDLLLRNEVDEKITKQALQYINSEAKRLAHLNSTLLNMTFVRTQELETEAISLRKSIDRAASVLQYNFGKRKNKLAITVEEVTVRADRNQLEVLLVNLLDNANKASEDGQVIELTGTYNKKAGSYELVIRDHGIGMSKEDLTKILEPFYMADKARTRKENGLGLGLTICSEICRRNQIMMSFESALGEGTSVTMLFCKENIVR